MPAPASPSGFDAIVIGGGPAGSTSAALLAEQGWRVLLCEKEPFPRYKIGESLIPFCWYPLQRLGLTERLERASFVVKKFSVQFANLDGRISTPFYFFQHSDHPSSRTWQVVRSEFDAFLLDNAVEKGVTVRRETIVRELLWEEARVAGVRAQTKGGPEYEVRAPITIDASGRDALAMTRQRWRVPDDKLKKLALWTYYKGSLRDPGLDEGATTIAYLPDKGWFWYIPWPNDMASVGVVAEASYLYRDGRDPAAIFQREAELQEWIKRHLATGERVDEFRTTAEFTYRSKHCATDGLVLVGDAYSFIDPVFSSGVFLALHGGTLVADTVHAALAAGDLRAERFEEYGNLLRQAIEAMRKLVHAFYDPGFSFGTFFRYFPELRGQVTDCLIGNLHLDFSALFQAMTKFAAIPGPLPHGAPLVPERR